MFPLSYFAFNNRETQFSQLCLVVISLIQAQGCDNWYFANKFIVMWLLIFPFRYNKYTLYQGRQKNVYK